MSVILTVYTVTIVRPISADIPSFPLIPKSTITQEAQRKKRQAV